MSELILSAEEKQKQMSLERTFMKQLFESVVDNQFIIFYELLIHYAATNHITIDDVLLQFKDGKKRTAFHFACQSAIYHNIPNTAINSTIIKPNDNNDIIQNDDNTIHYDSYIDNNDIVSRIIFFHQYNNDDLMIKTLTKDKSQSLPWISDHTKHQLIKLKDSDGLTPLMLSCSQCTNSILCQSRILALLKFVKVTPINCTTTITATATTTSNQKFATKLTIARSKIGATALHYLAANESIDGTTSHRTMKALYNDAPIALRTNSTKGGTPLHWACSIGTTTTSHIETIQTLILLCKHHINEYDIINQYDNTIPPALFVCIATNHFDNAKCFIENCIQYKINIIPTLQYILRPGNINIFHMIVDQNMISILFILIEYLQNADKKTLLNHLLSSRNDEGEIPLDIAAREKHIGCVMMLLQYNNELERSNNNTNDNNLNNTIEESTVIQYVEEYHQNKKNNNNKQKESQQQKEQQQQQQQQQINDDPPTATSDSLTTNNDDNDDPDNNSNSILKRYYSIVKAKCVELHQQQQSIEQHNDNNNKEDSDNKLSLKDIGNQYYQNKEYIQAIESYTKAIDIDPMNAVLYSNRSVSYLLLNEQMTPSMPTDDDNDATAAIVTPPPLATTTTGTTQGDDNDDNNKSDGVSQPVNDDDTTSISSSSYIELALYDALMSKELNPLWSKPYYRIATSLYDLKEYEDAAVIAWEGLSFVENQQQSLSTKTKSYHTEKNDLQILLQKCVKKGRNEHLSTLKQSTKSSVTKTN